MGWMMMAFPPPLPVVDSEVVLRASNNRRRIPSLRTTPFAIPFLAVLATSYHRDKSAAVKETMFPRNLSSLLVTLCLVVTGSAWSPPSTTTTSTTSRRAWLKQTAVAVLGTTVAPPAWAAPDCFDDCQKNCRLIAPKDPAYCNQNCRDYCEQPDRTGEFLNKHYT